MGEYNVEPQFVHVPHLRAIGEKSLITYNATVDLEAPSVAQVVGPDGVTESPRRANGSCQLSSRDSLEHNTADQNRTHRPWECGQA